jgi:hypothetical protein
MNAPRSTEPVPFKALGKITVLGGVDFIMTAAGLRPVRELATLIETGEVFRPLTSVPPHPLLQEASRIYSARLAGAAYLDPHYRSGTRHT